MRRRDRGWVWILLAAMGATTPAVVQSRVPGAAPAARGPAVAHALAHGKKSVVAKAGEPTVLSAEVAAKVRETLSGYLTFAHFAGGETDEVGARDLEAAASRYRGLDRRGQIFTVVATVPDPEKSDFDSFFDQEIDSIRTAARALSYLPDRFYLPWLQPAGDTDLDVALPKTPDVAALTGGATLRVKSHHEDLGDRMPGILVFRRVSSEADAGPNPPASPAIDLLVVLVVGETASQGVNRTALAAALDVVDLLGTDGQPHYVLGPFFSGSIAPLRRSLEDHRTRKGWSGAPHPRFVAISGSANGELTPSVLGEDNSFHTTQHQAEELHEAVIQSLRAHRIAELTEGTSWGQSLMDHDGGSDHFVKDDPRPVRFTTFEFPLHVARLRAEREKLKHEAPGDRTTNLRTKLELHLDHDRESADEVPVQSALTPYGVELLLQQQLTAIGRDGFSYLGIIATDPSDLMFLASEARKYCPKVQLFTLESNLIFAHPDMMRELDGMLVASTYPLAGDRGYSTNGAADTRLAFASQAAEGVFNATVALLGEAGAVGKDKRDHLPLRDYGGLDGRPLPPVWLTVVSNGALWPYSLVEEKDSGATSPMYRPPPGAHVATFVRTAPRPGSVVEVFYLALLLGVGVIGWWAWSRSVANRRRRAQRPHAVVGALELANLRYWLAIWLAITFATGDLSMLFMRLLPQSWSSAHAYPLVRAGLGSLCAAGALGMVAHKLAAQLALGYRALRDRHWPRRYTGLVALVGGVAVLGLACLAGAYVGTFALHCQNDPTTVLALERSLEPLSGVSPRLPLLFLAAGMVAWAAAGLREARALAVFPDSTPFALGADGAWVGLDTLAEPIRAAPGVRVPGREAWLVPLAATALGIYFCLRLRATLEGPWFDALFRAGFLTLLTLVVGGVARLAVAWLDLRRLLHRLAGLPMAEAFDRIGSGTTQPFGVELAAGGATPGELERAVRMAALLGRDPPPLKDAARAELFRDRIHEEADLIRRLHTSELRGDPVDARAGAQAALFRLSRTVNGVLDHMVNGDAQPNSQTTLDRVVGGVVPVDAQAEGPYRHVHTLALYSRLSAPAAQLWRRLAEDFVASQVLTLVRLGLRRMRALMTFAVAGALLLVCAANSYVFQPARFVTLFAWLVALSVLSAVLWVVVGVERDDVLSRVAQTRPGRVELNAVFLGRIAIYVGVPLSALVITNFPEVGSLLLSWIEPLVRALH